MESKMFIPGSEWIYFKLYTGTKTADAILKDYLSEYVWEMMRNDVIDKWFFIRYTDPDFHIRLRLHLKETRNFISIFHRFFDIIQPIINAGLVRNIQCDTYRRETERYGTNTISLVEDWFYINSEYIMRLFHQWNVTLHDQHRWKLSITLLEMDRAGELQVSVKSLMASLIHMTMNRWFRTKNRLHEMVIYDFLSRYYKSKIAREKYKKINV